MESLGVATVGGQKKLSFRGTDYPQRPAFFALRYQRMLIKTCAAGDVGFDGLALLNLVVLVEDIRRYASAPGFFNSQLQSHLGMTYKQLHLTRTKCADLGWLHYEAGGRRRQGLYWVIVPECYADLVNTDAQEFISPKGKQSGNQSETYRKPIGQPSYLDPYPKTSTPKEAAAVGDFESEKRRVERRLLELGLGKAVETVRDALPNGLTLAQMTAVIDYYASRPDAWGPGALRTRLVSPSAPSLASDQGWPAPSPKEKRRIEEAAAVAEQRLRSSERETSIADRDRMQQLELDFGERLDALPFEQQKELCPNDFARKMLVRKGPRAAAIRPQLLRAFAERYGSEPAERGMG